MHASERAAESEMFCRSMKSLSMRSQSERVGRIFCRSMIASSRASSSTTQSCRAVIVSMSVLGWMRAARSMREPAPVLQWLRTPKRDVLASPVRTFRSSSRLATVAGSSSMMPSTLEKRMRSVPLTKAILAWCSA